MATPIDDQGITPETISFRQVARIAGWSDQPLFMIGFEHSVCSRRFPIAIAPSQRHAQLLGDSLSDRYANQPMMPRFGWLPENDFPAHKSVNIKTSIRQAQTGKLHGEAAADIHSIAKEAEAVNETIADSVAPDIVSCDGPQPGRFYVFVRLFPGLLASSPWKAWVVLPDGDVDSVMLSDARKWARENWNTVVAVVQIQSRMRMGTPPHREDEESEAVERLLAEMLDRANRQTIKGNAQRHDEGETIKRTSTKEVTRPGESSEPQTLLAVESWSELAIGVGEDGYWALGHVPDVGSVFPKERAAKLDLLGDRWKKVLKLLANSPDGQSALKRDLFIELGYLSSAVKDEDIDDLRHDDGAMTKIKSTRNRLTQAMGDLSRELRVLVSAKDTKKRVAQISTSGDDHVHSLFTCRHLIRGTDGKLRFGSVGE